MSNELVIVCEANECQSLQDRITRLLLELGLRVRAVPSVSKQVIVWEAYQKNGILGLSYSRKYEYGKYRVQVDVHSLSEEQLNKFYGAWKK